MCLDSLVLSIATSNNLVTPGLISAGTLSFVINSSNFLFNDVMLSLPIKDRTFAYKVAQALFTRLKSLLFSRGNSNFLASDWTGVIFGVPIGWLLGVIDVSVGR